MKKKNTFLTYSITILGVTIVASWIFWVFNSGLKPNEFGDAVNPILNIITIIFLVLNWLHLKEELDEQKRINNRVEGIKTGLTNIEIQKNEDHILKQFGRGGDIDPLGRITIKLKNFGNYPVYLEEIRLTKISKDNGVIYYSSYGSYGNYPQFPYGNELNFTSLGYFGNNIIFPGEEIEGYLNIQAPNKINSYDEGGRFFYELIFKDEEHLKKLEVHFRYIGLIKNNKEKWFIPVFVTQRLVDPANSK